MNFNFNLFYSSLYILHSRIPKYFVSEYTEQDWKPFWGYIYIAVGKATGRDSNNKLLSAGLFGKGT